MIMTRSPLRISLGGGGTDLPSYYEEHSGFLIAAAIDKYVYITDASPVRSADPPEVLADGGGRADRGHQAPVDPRGAAAGRVGRTSGWRSPAWPTSRRGPGWGRRAASPRPCSRRCTYAMKNLVHPGELAEQACQIEIDILKEPVGKQDQYIAAFGGITCFRFLPNGQVEAWPLKISQRHALRPGGPPAPVLHRLHPLGRRDPQGTGRQEQEARPGA